MDLLDIDVPLQKKEDDAVYEFKTIILGFSISSDGEYDTKKKAAKYFNKHIKSLGLSQEVEPENLVEQKGLFIFFTAKRYKDKILSSQIFKTHVEEISAIIDLYRFKVNTKKQNKKE